MAEQISEAVKQAAGLLLDAEHATAICGAGVSVESGVPTFRGPNGIWSRLGAPSSRGYKMFLEDPVAWWDQQVDREADPARTELRDAIDSADPNPGHLALAELEALGILKLTITQNVDGLHQKAGSDKVAEIHGNREKVRCIGCESRWLRHDFPMDPRPPHCPKCGDLVKTDTVMFGEPVPPGVLERCYEETDRCDLMIAVGTSAAVYPAANLPRRVIANGGDVIEVNPRPNEADGQRVSGAARALWRDTTDDRRPGEGTPRRVSASVAGHMTISWHGLLMAFMMTACSEAAVIDAPTPGASAPPPSAVPAPVQPPPSPTATPVSVGPTPTATLGEMDVQVAFPDIEINRPIFLTYANDGTNRLFLVQQSGKIHLFENRPDAGDMTTFLDIEGQISRRGNEEGLLGLAFDPNYLTNGHFYVHYSADSPRLSVISRFSVSPSDTNHADRSSEQVIMEVGQPFSNHNGGMIAFGPDGYLYVGLGDGGSAGDPRRNGQDTTTVLGTILRIDVSSVAPGGTYAIPPDNPFAGATDGSRPEIWAYGLRNPWRFSFDRDTGDLWAGDVGQNRWEEIDLIKPGLNYGWNVMEGFHFYSPLAAEDKQLEPPVVEYENANSGGCSVTGGYVYRGSRLPTLVGAYIYGDFCSGRIWAIRYDGSEVTEFAELVDSDLSISSFGEDQSGELYILSFNGRIYELTPK